MADMIFSCPTLRAELEAAKRAENSDTPIVFMPARLHADPNELRSFLQKSIDETEGYDRILLCASGCGGGTKGLFASTADVVIPKTSDCIDILLSGGDERRFGEIYVTKSWMEFMKAAGMDFDALCETLGEEGARERLDAIFGDFKTFDVIDTGAYDTEPVIAFSRKITDAIGGRLNILKGEYRILHKLCAGRIDGDFTVIKKGSRGE